MSFERPNSPRAKRFEFQAQTRKLSRLARVKSSSSRTEKKFIFKRKIEGFQHLQDSKLTRLKKLQKLETFNSSKYPSNTKQDQVLRLSKTRHTHQNSLPETREKPRLATVVR
ncbi:hypothetical protein K0M31_012765 [Melipona bicolor]|uniref:Uncharacterized protein n=1 Tax=Melipona bicolor TaxID=60889 RepID=A0AA40FJJ1_9HYME|nr:hypothetical protein K0M31_012765 [Melipona bicolor]